jgi:uncharacterized protein (TIGR03437 family)
MTRAEPYYGSFPALTNFAPQPYNSLIVRLRPIIVLLALPFAPVPGRSASLALPNGTAVPGQIFSLSLTFSTQGVSVAGIQFDIVSDASLSFGVLPGAEIGVSAKVLYTAALAGGGFRVLIAGMNQGALAGGELVRLLIVVDPNASPGSAQIRISNLAASDPEGNAVAVSSIAATVQIVAGSFTQSYAQAGVLNAASLLAGPVSPGEIVTIFGRAGLSGTTSVLFNGALAPILYAGPGQVNAVVPLGLNTSAAASLELRTPGGSLGTVSLMPAPVSPALFTQDSNGTGPGAILNQDYSVNSYSNPASAGSTVMLYGTGFGALIPPATDGQIASGPAPTALPVTATIAGMPATVTYAGAAPLLITGVVQINVQIPAGLPPNPAAAVSLLVGGVAMPAGVTVSTH